MILHRSQRAGLYPLRHSRAGGNPEMLKAEQNNANLSVLCMSVTELIKQPFDSFQIKLPERNLK